MPFSGENAGAMRDEYVMRSAARRWLDRACPWADERRSRARSSPPHHLDDAPQGVLGFDETQTKTLNVRIEVIVKLFLCIFFLIMVALSPVVSSQGLPTVYWEFRDSLKTIVDDSQVGSFAGAVQMNMTDYKQISESGALKALRRQKPMKIDIILQDWYRANDGSDEDRANELQFEAKRILDSIKYQVIGYDLISENPWTLDSMIRANVRAAVLQGLDTVEIKKIVLETYLENNAVFKYGTENKKVLVVGLQDPILELFRLKLQQTRDALSPIDHDLWLRYSYLQSLTVKLQTELALAKLMIGLDQKYETRGALIVHDLYNDHLVEMLKFFRADSQTFGSSN